MAKYLLEMFAVSLLLTLLLELPAAWIIGMRKKENILLVFLVNVLTNPAAVLLHWLGAPEIPIEICVVAVEAAIYIWFSKDTRWKIPHPVVLSVLTNVLSWTIGSMIP